MGDESEKKGFLSRLFGGANKGSCCGSIELEELPNEGATKKAKKGSCCGSFELEEIPDDSKVEKEK
jgi:hypothetical protein